MPISIKTICLLWFSLLSIGVNAQKLITFEAGINNSSVRSVNIPSANPSSINNYFITFGAGKSLNRFIEIKSDLQLSTKGYDMRFGENQLDIMIYNYDYLSISPSISYRPKNVISLNAGLSYGLKLRERRRQAGYVASNWSNSKTINNSDLSYILGTKIHYQYFYFKLQFENSIRDVNNRIYLDENGAVIENAQIFNKSIQLGFGIYLWG